MSHPGDKAPTAAGPPGGGCPPHSVVPPFVPWAEAVTATWPLGVMDTAQHHASRSVLFALLLGGLGAVGAGGALAARDPSSGTVRQLCQWPCALTPVPFPDRWRLLEGEWACSSSVRLSHTCRQRLPGGFCQSGRLCGGLLCPGVAGPLPDRGRSVPHSSMTHGFASPVSMPGSVYFDFTDPEVKRLNELCLHG